MTSEHGFDSFAIMDWQLVALRSNKEHSRVPPHS